MSNTISATIVHTMPVGAIALTDSLLKPLAIISNVRMQSIAASIAITTLTCGMARSVATSISLLHESLIYFIISVGEHLCSLALMFVADRGLVIF